jgi:histone deacetylase complex subunit SAP18
MNTEKNYSNSNSNYNHYHYNKDKIDSFEVNREKICPFLLRVFYKENEFNSLDDLSNGLFPSGRELHIYTWMDATLREISLLIKAAIDVLKKNEAQLTFSLVFADSKGKLQRKEIGYIYTNKKSQDDTKTLHTSKFTVGDYLDIQINIK